MTKYIFVTGGVVSGLGKGITSASLGNLLKSRGLSIVNQKLDPYINVDPDTMNPFQHGEVFVTEDGATTDLDLGHYERFTGVNLRKDANVTTGSIYRKVIERERKGDYLGATVQVIPHITDEIKRRIKGISNDVDVQITEIGGTVGDIEILPYLEAARQIRKELGQENVMFIHVTLVPFIGPSTELKTKPTQHSVSMLRGYGISPDIIVLRSDRELDEDIKNKVFADYKAQRAKGERNLSVISRKYFPDLTRDQQSNIIRKILVEKGEDISQFKKVRGPNFDEVKDRGAKVRTGRLNVGKKAAGFSAGRLSDKLVSDIRKLNKG